MNKLITLARQAIKKTDTLPFVVYTSFQEQRLSNAPFINPVMIAVLEGRKLLGKDNPITCQEGHFVLIADSPQTYLRNIPLQAGYFALCIEFNVDDFRDFETVNETTEQQIVGPIDQALQLCLEQFVSWSTQAPEDLWRLRRKEILHLLYAQGYRQVPAMAQQTKVSHKIHNLVLKSLPDDITGQFLCNELAMSDSTLHRKLKAEGTTLQDVKDQARMGKALGLIQSTETPIGIVAQECGYSSQSRFTNRFKKQFGITPSALKKTRMTQSGENLSGSVL